MHGRISYPKQKKLKCKRRYAQSLPNPKIFARELTLACPVLFLCVKGKSSRLSSRSPGNAKPVADVRNRRIKATANRRRSAPSKAAERAAPQHPGNGRIARKAILTMLLFLNWKLGCLGVIQVVRTMPILAPFPGVPLHVHQPFVLAFRAEIQLLAPW